MSNSPYLDFTGSQHSVHTLCETDCLPPLSFRAMGDDYYRELRYLSLSSDRV